MFGHHWLHEHPKSIPREEILRESSLDDNLVNRRKQNTVVREKTEHKWCYRLTLLGHTSSIVYALDTYHWCMKTTCYYERPNVLSTRLSILIFWNVCYVVYCSRCNFLNIIQSPHHEFIDAFATLKNVVCKSETCIG